MWNVPTSRHFWSFRGTRLPSETSDLTRAEEILDRDHYGLEQVKERMLEFLAVRALTKQGREPDYLSGRAAPGTGKTSIARSCCRGVE